MADSILGLTTAELRTAYAAGDFTPVDALEATYDRIEDIDDQLGSIAFRNDAQARAQAEASAARWASGQPLGALDGIPISIKDSINAEGTRWTHGVAANGDLPMASVDTPPAARLKEAGAVIFAKTAMPDMGMLAAGVSSLYGIVRNPWNLSMNTGGSSAGAGAGLAAGIGSASIGTDIAGSVRLPAAHCGLVALKPTQGRIPHLAPSTVRSAGPMARTVAEAAELMAVISRPDPRDLLGLPGGPVTVTQADWEDLNPESLKVGVLLDLGYGFGLHPEAEAIVRDAAAALAMAGASVETIPTLFDHDPYPPLDRLFQVRALAEWQALPDERRDEVLPEIKSWAIEANGYTAADHERDLAAVLTSAGHVTSALAGYDIVLSATIPGVGHRAEQVGLDPAHPLAHCSFTCWYNQTGQPAANLPFGMVAGLPIGVQVIGQRFADAQVLAVTGWLESHRQTAFTWPVEPRDLPPAADDLMAAGYDSGRWA